MKTHTIGAITTITEMIQELMTNTKYTGTTPTN